ncbi:MAG: PIN domain-containing protein [Acidobacteriota bacterium]|mgnify:CR=1 FL=1
MSARIFLDTNLFVYSFDSASPAKMRRARQLIRQAVTSRNGVVSYQVVQEFFNVALKRFSRPMTVAEAEQYLATVFRPLLAVHSSHALYGEGLRLMGRYRLAWYDSLIVAAAIESDCSVLYSEDFQHGFEADRLRVENPFL